MRDAAFRGEHHAPELGSQFLAAVPVVAEVLRVGKRLAIKSLLAAGPVKELVEARAVKLRGPRQAFAGWELDVIAAS
jgi:hypothetical protein